LIQLAERVHEAQINLEYRSMKSLAVVLVVLASLLTIHFALGASGPDRPPGVDAQHWIPVSDKMGFVVTSPRMFPMPMPDRQVLYLTGPAEGYFMVHTGNVWQRLVIQDPLKGPGSSG
jgi:hypothetical protein